MRLQPHTILWAVLPAMMIASCKNAGEKGVRSEASVAAETVAADSVGLSGNTTAPDVGRRKIAHTAAISCRVKDVYKTTVTLETLVHATGGEVAESSLENQHTIIKQLPYVTDSLRQVQEYTTVAHMSLRIPVLQLDTVLHAIAAAADFIDARRLKQDELTWQFLGNRMQNDASQDFTGKALQHTHKTGDVLQVAEYADNRTAQEINRKIENMRIDDKVSYATLVVDLSQPVRIDAVIVPDTEHLMQPGTGMQLRQAWQNSLAILQALFVFAVSGWPVWVLAGFLVWVLRRYIRKSRAGVLLQQKTGPLRT